MDTIPTSFLDRLDAIIEQHYQDDTFSIEQLSKELTFSYSHTHRKIKEATGLSPSQYLCKKRLAHACILIETTELNLSSIAYQIGFNNQHYFSKCFSMHYGCPPSAFRKKIRLAS